MLHGAPTMLFAVTSQVFGQRDDISGPAA